MERNLTAKRLREVIHYDYGTGSMTWLIERYRAHRGSPAGRLDKSRGYVRICIDGTEYAAHRLAFLYMESRWPDHDVDHINLNKADNRWGNLREATPTQNQGNTSIRRDNTSGVKGVTFDRRVGKFQVRLRRGNKNRHIGSFATKEQAGAAYAKAARKQFGEFARI